MYFKLYLSTALADLKAITYSGHATAKVTCEYFGTNNPDSVKWYKDSVEVVDSSEMVVGEFVLSTR